jgi:hypothetical protein
MSPFLSDCVGFGCVSGSNNSGFIAGLRNVLASLNNMVDHRLDLTYIMRRWGGERLPDPLGHPPTAKPLPRYRNSQNHF